MLERGELEFQSILCYLKEGVLSRYFSQEAQNEPLGYDPTLYDGAQRTDYLIVNPGTSKYGKIINSEGRGWLSFELSELNSAYIYNSTSSGYVPTYGTPFYNYSYNIPTKRESNYISIRDQNGAIVDRSLYQLDYKNCRVRFPLSSFPPASGIVPTSIDYRFHSVSIMEGWPTEENIPQLPIVSLYPTSDLIDGFQIGPGVEFSRSYTIDIFATDKTNRKQLVDVIKQSLFNKHVTTIDFNRSGYPLKPHGVVNDTFIQNIEYNGNIYKTYLTLNPGNGQILYFFNIEVVYDASPRTVMADAMRHMAKIKFTTRSYSDRDPELVGKFAGLKEPIGGFDSLTKRAYTA